MRSALAISIVAVAIGFVALATDTACSSVPNLFCRGPAINRKGGEANPDRDCTECIEQQCCDLVGECQGTGCANDVASAHACVLDAGRGGGAAEPTCTAALKDDSRSTYQCMRSKCGDRCGLPVCKLDPLVPRLGDVACDRCFAGSCCMEMNACAKNRSCLLALECIVTKCKPDLARGLTKAAHPAAVALAMGACAPDDAGPPPGAGGNCIADCIGEFAAGGTEEAAEGRCLAAKVNECGADVECGDECAPPADAGRD